MSKEMHLSPDTSLDLSRYFSLEFMQEMLLSRWQKQHYPLPPRSVLLVLDLQESNQVMTLGLEDLEEGNGQIYSMQHLIELCHQSHQRLLMCYIKAMQELWSTEVHHSIWAQSRAFFLSICTAIRATKITGNQYSVIYFTVEPFFGRYPETSNLLFLWGHLLGDYQGEPLEVKLVWRKPQERLDAYDLAEHWLKMVRKEVYLRLRFTRIQGAVIKALAQQPKTVPQVAQELEISIRTVEGHCRNILTQARKVFKPCQFRTAQEVVVYLKRQHFLD